MNLGIMAGWTIFYIPKAIYEAIVCKERWKAGLSMITWLACIGIQGICLSMVLLIEKYG